MTEIIAIIDYGSGNLRSVTKAFERAIDDINLKRKVHLTADPDKVAQADRVVLPGVGAYADCKSGLLAVNGMLEALNEAVIVKSRPFLGICVGMQLMANRGLEKAITDGFGWIDADVIKITPDVPNLAIPQMGWNTLDLAQNHRLFDGINTGPDGAHAYFVHSYHMQDPPEGQLVATTNYGGLVTAAVVNGNRFGTQFHPEKSQAMGLAFIKNFLQWKP